MSHSYKRSVVNLLLIYSVPCESAHIAPGHGMTDQVTTDETKAAHPTPDESKVFSLPEIYNYKTKILIGLSIYFNKEIIQNWNQRYLIEEQ